MFLAHKFLGKAYLNVLFYCYDFFLLFGNFIYMSSNGSLKFLNLHQKDQKLSFFEKYDNFDLFSEKIMLKTGTSYLHVNTF